MESEVSQIMYKCKTKESNEMKHKWFLVVYLYSQNLAHGQKDCCFM
jgi:hypothetical protein